MSFVREILPPFVSRARVSRFRSFSDSLRHQLLLSRNEFLTDNNRVCPSDIFPFRSNGVRVKPALTLRHGLRPRSP